MATQSETLNVLINTIKGTFNNSSQSDAVVSINDQKFYVMSPLLEFHAPLLFAELKTPTLPVLSPDSTLSEQQLATQLASLFSLGKKVITITDPELKKDVVLALMECMYDKPVEITLTNAQDVYSAATKLGMKLISQKAEDIVQQSIKSVPAETFLEAYTKAMETKNPLMEKVWNSTLASKMGYLPIEKILEFTGKMSYEEIMAFVELEGFTCCEDTIYEVIAGWIKSNSITSDEALALMSKVKLDLLSSSVLITKAGNNQNVRFRDYQQALEKIVRANTQHSNRRAGLPYEFALGFSNKTYTGYRKVTVVEMKTSDWIHRFVEYYTQEKGIYCFDNHSERINICCEAMHLAILNNRWLFTRSMKQDQIIRLSATNHDQDSCAENISSIHVSSDVCNDSNKLQLFMKA